VTADPLPGLRDDLGVLGEALAGWDARTGYGTAAERKAASAAIGAVDSMLRQLYLIRGRLLREISTADAARTGRSGKVITMGMYLRLVPGKPAWQGRHVIPRPGRRVTLSGEGIRHETNRSRLRSPGCACPGRVQQCPVIPGFAA
jgi:hypothetical protein